MKICHVTWTLCYGGIETMLVNIANEQARLGHEVHIIVVNDLSSGVVAKLSHDVILHHLSRPLGSHNPWYILKLNLRLIQIRPDIIHLHSVKLLGYIPMRFFCGKVCATHHTTYLESDRRDLCRVPVLFTISEAAAKSIEENTGRVATVIDNGILTKSFRLKTDYTHQGRTFRIVQVGRMLETVKGQDIMLRATKLLIDEGVDLCVDFYGYGPDFQKIKELAAELELTDVCRFMGAVPADEISQILADYDLLVQPSRREGFGLTVVEAMAAGLPVLTSDLPAMYDLLDHGRLGLLFSSGDINDCVRAVKEAVESNLSVMAEAAMEMVCRKYDVKATVARYVEHYNSMCDKK